MIKNNKKEILQGCIVMLAVITLLAAVMMIKTTAKYASTLNTPNTINLTVKGTTSLLTASTIPTGDAYVVFSNDTSSLTFKYDDQSDKWAEGYTVYNIDPQKNIPDWVNDQSQNINSVYIDSTFKSYTPTSCANWFNGLVNCSAAPSDCQNINTSLCTNMSNMFSNYGANSASISSTPYVSSWDTSNVTDFSSMFASYGKSSSVITTVPDVSAWNTVKATNLSYMFAGFAQSSSIIAVTPNILKWNTAVAANLSHMFEAYAKSSSSSNNLTLNLANFNWGAVSSTDSMFKDCASLKTIICQQDIAALSNITNSTDMFTGCSLLTGGSGQTYDSSKTDKTWARPDFDALSARTNGYFTCLAYAVYTNKDISIDTASGAVPVAANSINFYYDANKVNWDNKASDGVTVYELNTDSTEPLWTTQHSSDINAAVINSSVQNYKIPSLASWFNNASNLASVTGLDNIQTTNIKGTKFSCSNMFNGCTNLQGNLDLSGLKLVFNETPEANTDWFTGNLNCMFTDCKKITGINLTGLNSVSCSQSSANNMFSNCNCLTTINCNTDLSGISTESGYENIFLDCTALVGGKGTSYDNQLTRDPDNAKKKTYAKPDSGTSAPGYFTYTTVVSLVGSNIEWKDAAGNIIKQAFITDNPSSTLNTIKIKPQATAGHSLVSVNQTIDGVTTSLSADSEGCYTITYTPNGKAITITAISS